MIEIIGAVAMGLVISDYILLNYKNRPKFRQATKWAVHKIWEGFKAWKKTAGANYKKNISNMKKSQHKTNNKKHKTQNNYYRGDWW